MPMLAIDLALFRLINGTWYHPALDPVFRFLSNWDHAHYYVLPIAAIVFFFVSHRWKYRFALILVAVALADILSSDVKILACRPRPYIAHPEIIRTPELYGYNSTSYSMPSNHAANMFAAAVVAIAILRRKRWAPLFFLPAFLIGYSRIYLGVHYPTDVLAGYAVGTLAAGIVLLTDRFLPALTFDETGKVQTFRWSGLTALLLVSITIFRFSALGHGESSNGHLEATLYPEEAQQWLWSRDPASAFITGGSPALPTLVRGSTSIIEAIAGDAPVTRVFALRSLAMLFALGVQLLGSLLAWRIYRSQRAVFFTAFTLIFMPLYALNAQLCLPQNAMLVCWAACVVSLHRALIEGKARAWIAAMAWLVVGSAFDVEMSWLAIGIMLVLLISSEPVIARKKQFLFLTAGIVGALGAIFAVIAGGMSLPNPLRLNVAAFGQFIVLQALGVSPVIFLWFIWIFLAGWIWRRKNLSSSEFLLLTLGTPVIFFSLMRASFSPSAENASTELLHLALPIYFTMAILACGSLDSRIKISVGRTFSGLVAATIFGTLIPTAMFYYICETPAFPRLAKNMKWIKPNWDPAFPGVGYQGVAEAVELQTEKLPNPEQSFVTATDSDTKAEMAFFLNGRHGSLLRQPIKFGPEGIVIVPGYQTSFDQTSLGRKFKTVSQPALHAVINKGIAYRMFSLFTVKD